MNHTPCLGQSADLLLGQEFLTWLWFRGATGAIFNDGEGRPFSVRVERRVVVEGGDGEFKETASVSGLESELREARLGLSTGKKVTSALISLRREPDEWTISLKAADFALGGLKTPKIEKTREDDEDREAFFLEKISLIESCLDLLDRVYSDFLRIRLDRPAWDEESAMLAKWIRI
ncbi:MAG: hypothetical protein LBS65_04215 [Desulfovibrio sp.]|jgi:hypothetical protein|nr:hypothetical protein [Desulfovibrio sp.]